MRKLETNLVFSPSDLITFIESEYASWMDRFFLEFPDAVRPDQSTPEEDISRAKGEEHEQEFLQDLTRGGGDVCNLKDSDDYNTTIEEMKAGREIIYQGKLALGCFSGFPDFLVRVKGTSLLGGYHYEAWDTKLARKPKPYFVIQLCCYSEMLAEIQQCLPEEFQVILGTKERRRFRTQDYFYYYRQLKLAFLRQQQRFDPKTPLEIPGPNSLGRWSEHATKILEARDDLSLIAGIRSTQVRKLRDCAINTARALAESDSSGVPGITPSAFNKLRRQAHLQIASRGLAQPKYEIIEPDVLRPRLGFAMLPPASSSDIYFDIEGYPFFEDGLEYLLGVTYLEEGNLLFRDWWAHTHGQEKDSFQAFVSWAHARWRQDPSMHIYHYAPYEVTALRRLMGRYAVCEEEVDQLLRAEVFVDLYSIVRQGLLVGEPAYSLKNIEKVYKEARTSAVTTSEGSLAFYHSWIENNDGENWEASAKLRAIRDYNREDCESTYKLALWLREVQKQARICYIPKDAAPESDTVKQITARALYAQQMRMEIPEDRNLDPERWRVHELLSWFLEFHRREAKPIWWAMYERHDMTEQQLIDDPDCLGGLVRTKRPPGKIKRSFLYEYQFDPDQETKLREGERCIFAHDLSRKATIHALDGSQGVLTIKTAGVAPPEALSLIPDEWVRPDVIVESIGRTVDHYRKTGQLLPPAIADFLYRRPPKRKSGVSGSAIVPPGIDVLTGAINAAMDLDNSTLCIQGPPGSGKTYTGAQMILALLRQHKRVGITSNSHRAICLLLNEAAKAAEAAGYSFRGTKIGGDDEDNQDLHGWIDLVRSSSELFNGASLPPLIGGTAWVFSRPEAQGTLDYLFVDEAGQVSVANLLGMAPSTKNIILIGDQMQLSQPIKGSHPGESGTSTLEYLLQGRATIPDDFGIFLSETWRMHPEVCGFISGAVYEGRLKPKASTAARTIRLSAQTRRYIQKNAGVFFVPVEHEGNEYESEEEVVVIAEIVDELLAQSLSDVNQADRQMTRDDILVVTPYNLQLRRLTEALPGVRVGTVDKFQGQEAAVVIYSMCASSSDASPRGIEFLFSRNRINVAISRARTLAIVVGNPALARTNCSTLEQMELVNIFCRVVETGEVVLSS